MFHLSNCFFLSSIILNMKTCLLVLTILVFHLFFQDTTSSSTTYSPGRRFKTAIPIYEHYTVQNVDRGIRTSKTKDSAMVLTYSINGESPDELIYHTDYHGVTTHPTPTPKHPNKP